jgi:hypothetical protein
VLSLSIGFRKSASKELEPRSCAPAELPADPDPLLLAEVHDPTRRRRRLVRDAGDSIEEERQPTLPVAFVSDGLKAVVVLLAVSLEEDRELEDRLAQDPLVDEDEADEQASDPAVAVQERVDRPGWTGIRVCGYLAA